MQQEEVHRRREYKNTAENDRPVIPHRVIAYPQEQSPEGPATTRVSAAPWGVNRISGIALPAGCVSVSGFLAPSHVAPTGSTEGISSLEQAVAGHRSSADLAAEGSYLSGKLRQRSTA